MYIISYNFDKHPTHCASAALRVCSPLLSVFGRKEEVVTPTPPFLDVNSCPMYTCQYTQKCMSPGTDMALGLLGYSVQKMCCQAQVLYRETESKMM